MPAGRAGAPRPSSCRQPRAVEPLHQQTRAAVGDRPQRRDDRFRAVALRQDAEAFDLLARRARAARGFARREREQIDAGEQVPARLQLRHGQTTAVAEKEEESVSLPGLNWKWLAMCTTGGR